MSNLMKGSRFQLMEKINLEMLYFDFVVCVLRTLFVFTNSPENYLCFAEGSPQGNPFKLL